jgi:hypothetical protein
MNWAVVDAIIFSFAGAYLFVLVHKYEPAGAIANLLKLLVLVASGAVVIHKLQPVFGIDLF